MKRSRKWLAVLLSVVLVLGLLPAGAWAEEGDDSQAAAAVADVIEVDENTSHLEDGKSYYLDGDVNLIYPLVLDYGATVTLDLRGHVLRRNDAHGRGHIIYVREGSTLILRDTGPSTTHSYTVGDDGRYIFDDTLTAGHKTITGGVITGGYQQEGFAYGGGITVRGTLQMEGGTIAGNYANSNGGGVTVVTNGSFIMTGGSICGNYAATSGGGLMVNGSALAVSDDRAGTVELWDGVIKENRVGGISEYYGPTGDGGGVGLIDGTITMAGTEITGNYAYGGGGGVSVGRYSTFIMNGGQITGNYAGLDGGGVSVSWKAGGNSGPGVRGSASFTMAGNSKISGNTAAGRGGGVFVQADENTWRDECKLSGTPQITDNKEGTRDSNLYLNGNTTFTDEGLTAGTSIGITVSDPPEDGNSFTVPIVYSGTADPGWFSSDDDAYEIAVSQTAQEGRVLVLKLKDSGMAELDPYANIERAQLAARIQQHTPFGLSEKTSSSANSVFSDVGHRSNAEQNAIGVLYDEKIMGGVGERKFNPDAADVTRAQAVVVIWRAAGSRSNTSPANIPYKDVFGGQWYTAAINCLYAMGVLDDTDMDGSGNFNPNYPVTVGTVDKWLAAYDTVLSSGRVSSSTVSGGSTRGEFVVQYYNYFRNVFSDSKRDRSKQPPFEDIHSCTEEEKEAITFWYQVDVIQGTSTTTFEPYSAASNVQIAAFIDAVNGVLNPPAEQISTWNLLPLNEPPDEERYYRSLVASLMAQGLLSENAGGYIDSNLYAPALTVNMKEWGANTGLATATPTFSPESGTAFDSSLRIALATETSDAKIYYTTDGSIPTESSSLYSGPITITSTTAIRAIAVNANGAVSGVAAATYTRRTSTPPADSGNSGNTGGSGNYNPGSSGGSSSNGNTGNSTTPTTSTATKTNPDGSTTTTATDKATGAVTETTTYPNGAVKVVETAANGVQVTTVRAPGTAVTASVTIPEGIDAVTVTIAAAVTSGTVAVDTRTGQVIKLSIPTADGLAVKLDNSADFVLADRSKDFSDIANHWAKDSIAFVSAHELFQGTSTSEPTFDPELPMTRAMLMTVLARLDSAAADGDSIGYEQGMTWAVANGVSDGSDPDGQITREQLATMLWRYAGSPVSSYVLDQPDMGSISDYAQTAMAWAVEAGILNGYDDGSLRPDATATRAVVATMIQRFCTTLV